MNNQGTTPPTEEELATDEREQLAAELGDDEEQREPSEIEVLQGETALLEQQLQQMRDRYIQAVADLDNARKRAKQAIGEARHQAVVGLLQELLPLMDNFERALESSAPTSESPAETVAVYEGVGLIYRQLKRLLEQRGVHPIAALGKPFDPDLHEAMLQVPASKEHPEGTVAVETQRGYRYGDQVLRHSRVGVAVKTD
jgi:molecular chaperone GrpE